MRPLNPTKTLLPLTTNLGSPALLINRRLLSDPYRSFLERKAFQRCSVSESYDVANSDGHLLQTPCGGGMASVIEDGPIWHLSGGVIARSGFVPNLATWLTELSVSEQKTIAVYNVCEANVNEFRKQGFIANKFGEEAILDLGDITWSGREFAWVRRQTSFCRRAGLDVVEVTCPIERKGLAATLIEILNEDFAERTYDKPLKLLEGQFDPYDLKRRRLFIANNQNGTVEAFLVCTPLEGGKGWAFETYRKRKDSTRGAMPFLFREVIDQLQAEGVSWISLCLIPGRNVEEATFPDEAFLIRMGLRMWNHHLDFLFNVQGQDHFKSRFRPRYVNRFICVTPKFSVRSFYSFLKSTGSLSPNWKNLMRELWKRKIRT